MAISKREYLDRLKSELEKLETPRIKKEYTKYFASVLDDIFQIKGDITRKKIRNVFNKYRIPTSVYNQSIISFFSLGNVNLFVNNKTKVIRSKKLSNNIKPFVPLITSSPVTTAKNINKKSVEMIGGITTLKDFMGVENAKKLSKISNDYKKEVFKLNAKLTTNLSRSIMRDLKKNKKYMNLTFEQKVTQLKDKYLSKETITINGVKTKKPEEWYVNRIVNTEIPRQNEQVNFLTAQIQGATHKRWISELLDSTRTSHKELHMKKIKINEKFKLKANKTKKGKSMKDSTEMAQPLEVTSPPSQTINCHCRAEYIFE